MVVELPVGVASGNSTVVLSDLAEADQLLWRLAGLRERYGFSLLAMGDRPGGAMALEYEEQLATVELEEFGAVDADNIARYAAYLARRAAYVNVTFDEPGAGGRVGFFANLSEGVPRDALDDLDSTAQVFGLLGRVLGVRLDAAGAAIAHNGPNNIFSARLRLY